VTVQEIKWVEGGGQPANDYTFFHRNRSDDHHLGTAIFITKI